MTTVDDPHDDLCEGQLAALTPTDCQCAQRARGRLVLVPGLRCQVHQDCVLDEDGMCPRQWVEDDTIARRLDDR